MSDFEYITTDHVGTDGRVGRITLNRPEKMNALSEELLYELNEALHDMEADSDVRVIIVRGEGRTFSAGYDLTPSRGGADAVVRSHKQRDAKDRRLLMGIRTGMQQITDIHMYFWNMAKVTIAQVHGYAIAGGCELAMMADLVVAAEDAQLGHPGVRLGTSRTGVIWPLVIGMRKAKELYYTGDNVTGKEAEEIGMINYAWPLEELDERTLAFADRLAIMSADQSRDPQGQHESLLREHGNLLVCAQQYRPRRDGPVHRAHLPVPGHDARAWAQGRAGLARRTVQR